jgi:peptidoglycan/LPS O-acetylase OafA/YrhL
MRRLSSMSPSRNQPLDILRGVAILLVLGFHYGKLMGWDRAGWIGVDLFFVLSGFLISGLLFSEYKRFENIDVVRFLIRRGFKLYPAFYALMCFTALECLLSRGSVPKTILPEVFFVQNYFPHFWVHTWSLAVEEHFYWMLPLCLVVMVKGSRNKQNPFSAIPWMFAFLAVACLALRIVDVHRGVSLESIHMETHLRVDSLFAGVTLGYYRHFQPGLFDQAARKPLWIPALLCLVPAFVFQLDTPLMNTIGFSSLYVGFGCLVVWAVDRPSSKRWVACAMAWIGRYSYSIYLWHIPVGYYLFKGRPGLFFFLEGTLASIAVGAGMSWLIEVPQLRLRDRLFPSRSIRGRSPVADFAMNGARSALSAGVHPQSS